jgi:DNA-binding MarR family transcriptional regulator
MSKQIASSGSKRRPDLLAELGRQVRLSQIASDKMDDAFSARAGVNLTDGRCIDLLDVLGGMTAGELAGAASLSPAAVTAVLDRLERSGLVTRTRDERDRRRVIVELTAEARSLAAEIYGPLAWYAAPYLEELSDSELEVIVRFLAVSSEINERRAAELRE